MKDFGIKFQRAFEEALKPREGLDRAVQAWKDRVSQITLSGYGMEDFEVFHRTNDSVGIRQKEHRD